MSEAICFQSVGTESRGCDVFMRPCVMLNVTFIMVCPPKSGGKALITSHKDAEVNFCSHVFNQLLRV